MNKVLYLDETRAAVLPDHRPTAVYTYTGITCNRYYLLLILLILLMTVMLAKHV